MELSVIIALAALVLSLFRFFNDTRRGVVKDTEASASSLTTVIVNLETIKQGVSDIKSELGNVKNDIREVRDKTIRIEESNKQAHKRIDELSKKLEKCGICHEHMNEVAS